MTRNDHRQRPRPEPLHEPARHGGNPARHPCHHRHIGHMDNQRIVRRPSLRAKDGPDRLRIQGVRPEPVHRLGRKRHHASRTQEFRGHPHRPRPPGWNRRHHEARFTIQAEKPSRNRMNPGRCSSGNAHVAGASASTTRKQRNHSCRAASSIANARCRARIIGSP